MTLWSQRSRPNAQASDGHSPSAQLLVDGVGFRDDIVQLAAIEQQGRRQVQILHPTLEWQPAGTKWGLPQQATG